MHGENFSKGSEKKGRWETDCGSQVTTLQTRTGRPSLDGPVLLTAFTHPTYTTNRLVRASPETLIPAIGTSLAPLAHWYSCLTSHPAIRLAIFAHVSKNQIHRTRLGSGAPLRRLCELFRLLRNSRLHPSFSVVVSLGSPCLHAWQHAARFHPWSQTFPRFSFPAAHSPESRLHANRKGLVALSGPCM